ncbi:MAG: hypothetical protein KF841_03030 [Phycisphaerae bacterium]|nr:hypothetical protein [Phycisphaerae bacterium]
MDISLPGKKTEVGSPARWKLVEGAAGKGLLYLALVNASGEVLKKFSVTKDIGDKLARLSVNDIVNITFDACKSKLGLKRWGE